MVSADDKGIVSAILSNQQLRKLIFDQLLSEAGKECEDLCRKKGFTSVLRQNDPIHLMQFSHVQVLKEWENEAPLFLEFLHAVAAPLKPRNVGKRNEYLPSVCAAGSILLKERNVHMSAFHHLMGIILFHGNASKQVIHGQVHENIVVGIPINTHYGCILS